MSNDKKELITRHLYNLDENNIQPPCHTCGRELTLHQLVKNVVGIEAGEKLKKIGYILDEDNKYYYALLCKYCLEIKENKND